jgi:hypothetical protein
MVHEVDAEMALVRERAERVFDYLLLNRADVLVPWNMKDVAGAAEETLSASNALGTVDIDLSAFNGKSVCAAPLDTAPAGKAAVEVDFGANPVMHRIFAGAGPAPHADILEGAAEA